MGGKGYMGNLHTSALFCDEPATILKIVLNKTNFNCVSCVLISNSSNTTPQGLFDNI